MSRLSGIPSLVTTQLQSGLPAEIPSPTVGVWHLGPIPIRGYAMCILAGIIVAVWLTQRRLSARGYRHGVAIDISAWAVPFGIIGGRLYHLITTPQPYFGEGGNPWNAFKIYEGGLGIWGAVALGAVGALIGCRKNGVSFRDFVDAAAPGLAIAQAMGRFGNWFNNEIYGAPTDLPWRLKIYEWDTSAGRAVVDAAGNPVVKGYFHPTFLYEALWCLVLAAFLLWLGRRFELRSGQTFAAYVMGYPIGRIVIENMRTDSANHILGQRVNTWVSLLVFLLGVWLWFRFGRMDPPPPPVGDDGAAASAPTEAAELGPEGPAEDLPADAPADTGSSRRRSDR
ncbi:diacylglyceryl transferase [Intrasporangium oryzae NRRL B-24470]|uniref:Phosphatidylglycerol--prolipoprotein diacylglyceryl transferase n=1 Tax=Intrasporangium oryzae NRRL B-24470 TaxID=1386089 RepID=W9G9Z2_9MICO|nr:prolipoprotein diacylglyceryl transferase [Intrasporangium oryzae]EWT02900.1 diacylglyceryl transferase [Intrasporangium oryzae NRRL B-24470]